MSPARARRYASTIHCCSASVAPRSRPMAGRATPTAVPSLRTTASPRIVTTRIQRRREASLTPPRVPDRATPRPAPSGVVRLQVGDDDLLRAGAVGQQQQPGLERLQPLGLLARGQQREALGQVAVLVGGV